MADSRPCPKDDQQGGIHWEPEKPQPYADDGSAALHIPKQVTILKKIINNKK